MVASPAGPLAVPVAVKDLVEVSAWYRAHPGSSQAAVAAHFQIDKGWVSRHWKAITTTPAPEVHVHTGPRLVMEAGTAGPAIGLTPSDREMALGTVRRIYRALRIAIDKLLVQLEEDETPGIPRIDVQATQALLNLQRIAQSMVDAHPGLLQLGGDDEEGQSREVTEDELMQHLAAIERGSM